MSIEAISAVWKLSKSTLGQRLVLLALADFANDQFESWPSVETIAKKSLLSERNTRLCLRKLEASGEIKVIPGDGMKGTNRYIILVRFANFSGGQNQAEERGKIAQKGGAMVAPNPSVEPSVEPSNKQQQQFPEELNCPDFASAWADWNQFRIELKKKLTPSTIKRQLKFLSQFGLQGAIASINRSIEKGWQGLFPPEQNRRHPADLPKAPIKAGKSPPPGLLPISQQPNPGTDGKGNEITLEEWDRQFPLWKYYDERTLEPCAKRPEGA